MKFEYPFLDETCTPYKFQVDTHGQWMCGDILITTPYGYFYTIETKGAKRFKKPQIVVNDIISSFKNKVKMNPFLMAEVDLLEILLLFGVEEHEIEQINSEIDECLNEMAQERTGKNLDDESKLILRNELLLGLFELAIKEANFFGMGRIDFQNSF